MSIEPDLLSMIAEIREEAINRVEENADSEWKAAAYETGFRLAVAHETLTSNDIFDAMPRTVRTHDPRAMGPVLLALKRDGILEATDRFTTSTSLVAHGRPTRIWQSRMARTNPGEC
jgi:hypothetical protein